MNVDLLRAFLHEVSRYAASGSDTIRVTKDSDGYWRLEMLVVDPTRPNYREQLTVCQTSVLWRRT